MIGDLLKVLTVEEFHLKDNTYNHTDIVLFTNKLIYRKDVTLRRNRTSEYSNVELLCSGKLEKFTAEEQIELNHIFNHKYAEELDDDGMTLEDHDILNKSNDYGDGTINA